MRDDTKKLMLECKWIKDSDVSEKLVYKVNEFNILIGCINQNIIDDEYVQSWLPRIKCSNSCLRTLSVVASKEQAKYNVEKFLGLHY